MKTLFAFLLASFSYSVPLLASNYYVATSGSDSNNCTSLGTACRTISRATSLATSPGSIVLIGPGTYKENVSLSHSGTAANPIALRGYTGASCPTVVVNDVNHPTGVRYSSSAILIGSIKIAANYQTIDCIHVEPTGDGGINVNSGTIGGNIKSNEIGTTTTANNSNGGGILFAGVYEVKSSQYASSYSIKYNYIHGVSTGIFLVCSACKVGDNEIAALAGDEPGSDHDYIDAWGVGTLLQRNYMHDNTANSCYGYDCHMDCVQSWNTTGDGTEVAKNITFNRNICFNHHEGVIVQDNASNGDVSNWTVTNNVFAYGPYDDGSGHLAQAGVAHPWCWVFQDGNLGKNKFLNNTCIDGAEGFEETNGSAVFQNNIWLSLTGSSSFYQISGSVTGANNLSYSSASTSPKFPGDIVNLNPRIVSPGSSTYRCIGCNFNILSGGAGINAGVASGVENDLLGTLRPAGSAYDIGAYEYKQ